MSDTSLVSGALTLREWVAERLSNCKRFASMRTGADRDGWLEDAEYFETIIRLFAEHQSELATLTAALALRQWQPIATAKGGKPILLRHVDGRYLDATRDEREAAWVGRLDGLWYHDSEFEFTHWQPLPEPPPSAKEG